MLKLPRRRRRTIYGCGNCREQFATREELLAHHPCPLYLIEKELAERNAWARWHYREVY